MVLQKYSIFPLPPLLFRIFSPLYQELSLSTSSSSLVFFALFFFFLFLPPPRILSSPPPFSFSFLFFFFFLSFRLYPSKPSSTSHVLWESGEVSDICGCVGTLCPPLFDFFLNFNFSFCLFCLFFFCFLFFNYKII